MRAPFLIAIALLALVAGEAGRPADTACIPTAEQTEGPYYKPGAPFRRVLVEPGMPGTRLVLTGRVLGPGCRPALRAVLDFWQADAEGVYDNTGFRLRGRQRVDSRGSYRLETVVPGLYPGRTRHIHVKVRAASRPVLTSQLYFPGTRQNDSDGIFDGSLVLKNVTRAHGRMTATFTFVLSA